MPVLARLLGIWRICDNIKTKMKTMKKIRSKEKKEKTLEVITL